MPEADSALSSEALNGDPVALARALVAVPSVNPLLSPSGDGEGAVGALARGWLEAWGLETELVDVAPGRVNVMARLRGEGATLLLNGHLDTVGVAGMSVPPFAAEVVDGRLVGRGACDMKGGVASLLAATRRLSLEGPRPNLVVALTADEEHASLGMQALVASGVRADMAVVCEPTGLAVMPAHKGFVWIRAEFKGRAAHGSRPEQGVDAIRHAGLFMAALDDLAKRLEDVEAHPLLGRPSFHAGTIQGGTAESIYPDSCVLLLERRTLPGERDEDVLAEFQEVLGVVAEREPDLDASLRVTLARPGTEVAEDGPLVEGLLRAAEAAGAPARVEGMTAWVDAAFLNEAAIPAVCYGPGDTAQAHSADEWCEVEEIRTCAEVLERFARALSGGS